MDRFDVAFGTADTDIEDDLPGDVHDDIADPPSPVGQDERRMQVRAYNHWASLLGDKSLPDIEDLEPHALDDFGPYSVLLDFSTGIENPAVRYVGPALAQECGVGTAIQRLSDVPTRSLLSRITDHYMQILANEAPIGFEAEFVNQRGATALYRGILLPYSSDGETIDFIYGVINWKELADQRTAEALLDAIDETLARGLHGGEPAACADAGQQPEADEPFELTEALVDDGVEDGDALCEPDNTSVLDLAGHDVVPAAATDSAPMLRTGRGIDALGNPLGTVYEAEADTVGADADGAETDAGDGDGFDTRMKTAADYGLPEWDEEPEGQEDDHGLVDPLAGDEATSSLISLVTRGERAKQPVNLGPSVPAASLIVPALGEAPAGFAPEPFDRRDDTDPREGDYDDDALAPPAGLHDCLAAAREQAEAASSTEDRSRRALYAAVGLAYDFSLEAAADPEAFAEIVADAGLTVQDRAPMTPIVKLVFGGSYDKTRLTEYAAVLSHAHRRGVERGALPTFLRGAEGGLKGIVQAERSARREEQGKPAEAPPAALRDALAAKLRARPVAPLADLAADGEEFALVMVRRMADGTVALVGELPPERALLEKAARTLIAQ